MQHDADATEKSRWCVRLVSCYGKCTVTSRAIECVGLYYKSLTYLDMTIKCRKYTHTVAFGNTTHHMKPYTDGHADKAKVSSSAGRCAAVTEARSESRRTMTVTEPASIVHLHCVTWEWGQQETFPLLNHFKLSHQNCHNLMHNTETHTAFVHRLHESFKKLQKLPSVQAENGRRRQIRRGTWCKHL